MISVIVPVYNVEKFLPKCLDSIINQTYKDLEIIVINDGSTDNSGAICDEYAQRDKRIKVIHKENAGVSAARNDGLKCATGEYITFVDSDDCLELDMYEFLLSNLLEYSADVSHCGYKRMNENDEIIRDVNATDKMLIQSFEDAIICMLKGQYFVGGLWNKLYSKTVLENIFFDESLKNNEDILFNVLAFNNSNVIVFEDKTKYLYYEHGSSVCNTLDCEKKMLDSISVKERIISICESKEIKVFVSNLLFDNHLNYYQFLRQNNKDFHDEKKIILSLKNKDVNLTKKQRIKWIGLSRFWILYKAIYFFHSKLRTPNWDATVK